MLKYKFCPTKVAAAFRDANLSNAKATTISQMECRLLENMKTTTSSFDTSKYSAHSCDEDSDGESYIAAVNQKYLNSFEPQPDFEPSFVRDFEGLWPEGPNRSVDPWGNDSPQRPDLH